MHTLTVALLQMTARDSDQTANQGKGEAFCRLARAMGADIALFPEMWNIGYGTCPPEANRRVAWQAQAIGPDGEFVTFYRGLARELDMAIALTYLEHWPRAPRNTVSLIDRHGEIVLTYAKVHTCDFDMEAACTPGDDYYVCALDTASGPVKIGAMICFDREFPESARILMLKGAEIILTPNACVLDEARLGQFRARAFENMVGLAMTNYAAPQDNGHSVAYDAMMYSPDGHPVDPLIVMAGEAEGIFLAPFDITRLRAYREREVWGNAYRKPGRYGALLSAYVTETFVRKDARR
jgi:predicted amidohydrolase